MLLFGQTTGGLHLCQHYTQLLTVSKQSAVSVIPSPASSLITSIWSTRFERTDSPIARPLLTLNVHVCFCCVDPWELLVDLNNYSVAVRQPASISMLNIRDLLVRLCVWIIIDYAPTKPYTSSTRISKSPDGHNGGLLNVWQRSVLPNRMFSSIQIAWPSLKMNVTISTIWLLQPWLAGCLLLTISSRWTLTLRRLWSSWCRRP